MALIPLYTLNFHRIPDVILGEAKKKKQVVYGGQALNVQIPSFLHRNTYDFDIYAKNPRRTANVMQRKLDREVAMGEDIFYSKPAIHKGTYRVMNKGEDRKRGTSDDYEEVDYTEMPSGIGFVSVSGVRYERLGSISKNKEKILKNPEARYRHEKDKADLQRIKAARILKRGNWDFEWGNR